MADFTFINLTADPQYIGDFGTPVLIVPASGQYTITDRESTELPAARDLQGLIADGSLDFVMTPTQDEIDSGLLSPPVSISGDDMQPVDATSVTAAIGTFHKEFAAGGGGAPDDVVLFAANAIPFKCRLLDVVFHVTTFIGASSITLYDEAAAAGSSIAAADSSAVGRKVDTTRTATFVLDQSTAAKGLFLYRSDSGVAGSVTITYRREN